MVQVDVFWSYGIGAGFALAAAPRLRREPLPPLSADRHLTATLLYAGALFAPSGAWLLWAFPDWETMQVGSRTTIPAWLVALFAATNVTQAALGYAVTRALVRRDRPRLAYLQLVGAYAGMFFILVHGWDGTGYRRFFSPTAADFRHWADGPATAHAAAWATSPVALTLYGMGAVLLPLLFWPMARWHPAGWRVVGLTLASVVGVGLGGAILASLVLHWAGPVAGAALVALGVLAFALPRSGPAARLAAGFVAVPDGSTTVDAGAAAVRPA